MPVFAPNLAQFSKIILIISIDRKLALTVYFHKIYSFPILVLVLFELQDMVEQLRGANITDGSVVRTGERRQIKRQFWMK